MIDQIVVNGDNARFYFFAQQFKSNLSTLELENAGNLFTLTSDYILLNQYSGHNCEGLGTLILSIHNLRQQGDQLVTSLMLANIFSHEFFINIDKALIQDSCNYAKSYLEVSRDGIQMYKNDQGKIVWPKEVYYKGVQSPVIDKIETLLLNSQLAGSSDQLIEKYSKEP